jgi:hypothetical protein
VGWQLTNGGRAVDLVLEGVASTFLAPLQLSVSAVSGFWGICVLGSCCLSKCSSLHSTVVSNSPSHFTPSPLHPPHHVRFPCSGRVDNDSLTLLPSSPIDVWAVGRNRVHLSFSRTNFSLAPEPTLASPPTSLFLDLYSRIEPL